MSGRMNWGRVAQEARLSYVPKAGSLPASQRQLGFIVTLCREKGRPVPKRLPLTKKRASEMIDELLALPDKTEHAAVFPDVVFVEPEPPGPTFGQEMVIGLRERYPQLSPMTANSLVQLFGQIDSIGLAFVLDGLAREAAPQDPTELILHILRRFLEEFAPVTPG